MPVPHVILLPEGVSTPDGYVLFEVEKGRHAGRYAVLPKPRCDFCIPRKAGLMMATAGGAKVLKEQPCGCVITRVAEFCRRQGGGLGALTRKPVPGKPGKTHRQVRLEQIDKALAQKTGYVEEREAIVAKLEEEREVKLAEVQAEVKGVLDAEQDLLERISTANRQTEEVVRQLQELNEQLKDLRHRVTLAEQDLETVDVKAARSKVHIVEVEYAAAVENVKDGRYRRYQADVARLLERRAKVAGEGA